MNPSSPDALDKLIQAICGSAKYSQLAPSLRRALAEELKTRVQSRLVCPHPPASGNRRVSPLKLTREMVGYYKIHTPRSQEELQAFCRRMMRLHNSTADVCPMLTIFSRPAWRISRR